MLAICAAFSSVPPFFRWAVAPVARNLWFPKGRWRWPLAPGFGAAYCVSMSSHYDVPISRPDLHALIRVQAGLVVSTDDRDRLIKLKLLCHTLGGLMLTESGKLQLAAADDQGS